MISLYNEMGIAKFKISWGFDITLKYISLFISEFCMTWYTLY